MRKLLFTSILLCSISIFSQESQKGLLWKITSKNSIKPSYLYGNMHVSEKIAFHLGEEFFAAIKSVDKIALESNPIVWLDQIMESDLASNYIGRYSITRGINSGFYEKAFKLSIPENNHLSYALSSDHYFMNWLLYREDKSRSDFEEETFLDMFIYQSGAKNGKEVLSLEDFRQTTKYSILSAIPDIEEKEPSKWLKKLTKEKDYNELLEEAYRTQNLNMIDSLQQEVSSNNGLYWMLYKRNEIMAQQIDSIIQSGTSLFSAVGAAHLAGEKGILQLLKKMGYSVSPMPVTFSDKAREQREIFDRKKLPPSTSFPFKSEMFNLVAPVKIYETPYSSSQRHFFGPELTNGSHFTIKQISTYGILKGISREKYIQKLDSLLFENIPGKIESKTFFKEKYFDGFDILNKTKTGDYQRYKIYITPLHIIIFKMGGKDNFVKDEGSKFFESIKLKMPTKEWKNISTIHKDFSIDVPDYYSITYNNKVSSLYGEPALEAFNLQDSSYYYVSRNALYDWSFIEEDNFESKRIAEQYFLGLKLDTVIAEIVKDAKYPTALAFGRTKDSSYLAIKVVINGPFYYLMSATTKNYQKTNRFFSSFKVQDFDYTFDFAIKTDSSAFIKVNSNYLNPEDITYTVKKAYKKRREKNKTKNTDFKEDVNTTQYCSETFEKIQIRTSKFHDYENYENIDSLWNKEIKSVSNDHASSNYLKVKNTHKEVENGNNVLYVSFNDTGSSRAIIAKYILKNGLLIRVKALTDTTEHKSKFVENFFKTITPLDTVLGRSIFEDKASLFFKSIYGTDSLAKETAFESIGKITFKAKDIDSLKITIDNYKFPANRIQVKKELIGKLINIKNYESIDYISKLYKNYSDTAMYQIEILNALAQKGTKNAMKEYLKLLDFDIPISGNDYDNFRIFYPLNYSLYKFKDKTTAFPELLNYTFISKYRDGIIGSLAFMVDSNYINPKVYKGNLNQLLREAKIVLKEQISFEQNKQGISSGETYYSYNNNSNRFKYENNELLVNYATILIPFAKNKKVNEFLMKFKSLKNYTIRTEVFTLMQKNGLKIDTSIWNELAKDPINIAFLYNSLEQNKLIEYLPKKYINQEVIVKSLLFDDDFDFEKDSLLFIEKRWLNDGKDSGWIYFYKTKREGVDEWELNYCGYQPRNFSDVSTKYKVKETQENIDKSKEMNEIILEKINILMLKRHPHADGSGDDNNYYYD